METSALHRSTRHTAAVASGALPPVLEGQVKGLFKQAQGSRGNHRVDQRDGEGESALGCREDSRGIIETRHACLQAHHSEVYEASSHAPAKRPEVGNLCAQSRSPDLGLRLPAGHGSLLSTALCLLHHRTEVTEGEPCRRDTISDRSLCRATPTRSHSLGASTEVSDLRS